MSNDPIGTPVPPPTEQEVIQTLADLRRDLHRTGLLLNQKLATEDVMREAGAGLDDERVTELGADRAILGFARVSMMQAIDTIERLANLPVSSIHIVVPSISSQDA